VICIGPILHLTYINDLDDDITSNVLKLADGTRVWKSLEGSIVMDIQHLEHDHTGLNKWSKKWHVFKFRKCKCMHTGRGNEDVQHTMRTLY